MQRLSVVSGLFLQESLQISAQKRVSIVEFFETFTQPPAKLPPTKENFVRSGQPIYTLVDVQTVYACRQNYLFRWTREHVLV